MISIVVPTYNGVDRLRRALESIEAARERYDGETELVVVADGCVDATEQAVAAEFPQARLIALSPNVGFAGAVRAGVAATRGELLAILSDDLRLEPDFLGPLAAHFDDPNTFSVMPRILDPSGERLDIPPYYPTERLGQLKLKEVADPPATSFPCFFTAGGIALFRRAMFEQLGGFSRLFAPGYHEDVDVCWRAWARGWTSRYEPAAVTYHHHQQGAFRTRYGALSLRAMKRRNWLLLNLIHLDRGVLSQLAWFLIRGLRRDLLRPARGLAVLAALPGILTRLPAALRQRRIERAERRHANAEVFALIPADPRGGA